MLKPFPFHSHLPMAAAALALAWLPAGCGPRRDAADGFPRVWAVGPSEVVHPTDAPRDESSCFNAREQRVCLTGAINETVAFELVLTAGGVFAAGLEVTAEDLTSPSGSLPRAAVHLYRHWPIAVERFPNWYLRSIGPRRPREIPDALVPIDAPQHGQPFTLAPGRNLVLWVEIRIPLDTRPGRYDGALVVRMPGAPDRRVPLRLDVRDVLLSPEEAIPVLARVRLAPIIAAHTTLDPANTALILQDSDARALLHETFALLQRHGLSPFTEDVRPGFSQDIDGSIRLDWSDYETFCGPLIDGTAYADGRAPARWPLPVDLAQPDPAHYGGLSSTVYSAVLRKYLAAVTDHFERKGRLERAFVCFDLPRTPNPREEDLERIRALARLTHLASERLRFATRLVPQPMAPFGWFEHVYEDLTPFIDIWSTPARYQHPPTLSRLQMLGRETWLPPDRPPFSGSIALEAPPIHARSLTWQAFLQGHAAILLDEVTAWPERVFDRPLRDRHARSDTWLIYPGTLFGLGRPVPSVRLKQLQQGIQDYQKLRLLAEHGRARTAQLIARSLIKAAGTDAYGDNYQDGLFGGRVDDPLRWALARDLVDDELASALSDTPELNARAGATRAEWARFLGSTRTIEARAESARLRWDDRPGRQGWLIRYDVAIRNEMPTALTGRLRFGPLPAGTTRVSDIVRVGPVPEMGLARERLVARSTALPVADLDGHHAQEIILDAGPSGQVGIEAITSIVLAPAAGRPIRVDGDLSDWPPAPANSAGDFRLITAGADAGLERAPATNQTIACFSRNGDTLYIGIHAAAPGAAGAEAAHVGPYSNRVEYEDLMPVGEDLVEILIDPTNAGTQSGDLYHIVVKATGNPRFERGVDMTPPIGRVRPWPGGLPDCAVVSNASGWSAEIAIPIDAFGPDAGSNRVWGVNLARLDPINGEYSDWARAPRYCYDPRTLGNLVWPD